MSNRFATIALTIFASLVGVFILFVCSLFLFPGVYMFGVKYIAPNTHSVTSGVVDIKEKVGNFSGVIVNSYEVPVIVEFNGGYDYTFEYADNYNGLTTSNISNPSYTMEKDDNGNVVITISEFHTIIYQSVNSERYVKISLPLKDIAVDDKYATSFTLNSTKSAITFQKEQNEDTRIPRFYGVSITTNGNVKYSVEVKANTYTYNTNNSITIDKNAKTCVDAENYNLTSNNGNITIIDDVSGDLNLKTDQGKILLRSCKNLTAETRYGNIGYYAITTTDEEGKTIPDEGSVKIGGIVVINARSGSVTLGEVEGVNGNNNISTTSGNVKIKSIYDGSVETQRGSINIESVRNFTAKSNSGKINITKVTGSLNTETARGAITLGSETEYVKDIKVFSRIGKVSIQSASGKAEIETLSSDIRFINGTGRDSYVNELKITCGGELYAEGLRGNVEIKSEKDVSLSFANVSEGNTYISLGDKCTKATVYALNNLKNEVNYVLVGKRVIIQENQNNSISKLEEKDRYEIKADSPYSFKAEGANVELSICFKSSI